MYNFIYLLFFCVCSYFYFWIVSVMLKWIIIFFLHVAFPSKFWILARVTSSLYNFFERNFGLSQTMAVLKTSITVVAGRFIGQVWFTEAKFDRCNSYYFLGLGMILWHEMKFWKFEEKFIIEVTDGKKATTSHSVPFPATRDLGYYLSDFGNSCHCNIMLWGTKTIE